jgi:hypothetical protein
MPTQCGAMSRGRVMRLTRLDDCGLVVPGPAATLVTSGFVQVVATPVYQDQEDISVTNANGDLCVDDQSDPALRWLTLQMDFCNIDPDAINIISGAPLVVDDAAPTPNDVGFRWDTATLGTANFALEVWSGIKGQGCTEGGFENFGYWLYPYVVQAQLNEYTVAAAGLTLSLTARTSAGSGWGVGPYDVVRDVLTPFAPGPLVSPITATQHGHFQFTNAPLPTAACGAVVLPAP